MEGVHLFSALDPMPAQAGMARARIRTRNAAIVAIVAIVHVFIRHTP
jgi:hypothetical protein